MKHFILSFFLVIALICISLILSLDILSQQKKVYVHLYEKYQVDQWRQFPDESTKATNAVIEYLANQRSSLQEESLFGAREIRHMKDVKNLFNGARILALFLIVYVVWTCHRLTITRKTIIRWLGIYIGILALFIILMPSIVASFSDLFIQFHHLFFQNEDWILDPKNSIIIRLMPEGFFASFALYIGIVSQVICLLLFYLIFRHHAKSKNDSYHPSKKKD